MTGAPARSPVRMDGAAVDEPAAPAAVFDRGLLRGDGVHAVAPRCGERIGEVPPSC